MPIVLMEPTDGTGGQCRKGTPVGAKETDKSVKEKKAKIQEAINELKEKAQRKLLPKVTMRVGRSMETKH